MMEWTRKNIALTVLLLWGVALFTVFVLIGSNARPVLWVFILFGVLSYLLLAPKKAKKARRRR